MDDKFKVLTAALMGIAGFTMVLLLVILLFSSVKSTPLICNPNEIANATASYYDGVCYQCNYVGVTTFAFNSSALNCYNTSSTAVTESAIEFSGTAYNATKSLSSAVGLVPQFMQIIVIAIIFMVLIGLLAVGGVMAYNRIKKQ